MMTLPERSKSVNDTTRGTPVGQDYQSQPATTYNQPDTSKHKDDIGGPWFDLNSADWWNRDESDVGLEWNMNGCNPGPLCSARLEDLFLELDPLQ